MIIRPVAPADVDQWVRMRTALWPGDQDEHRVSVERFFAGDRHEPAEVLVAEDADGLVGFAELSLRNIVDSCRTHPVGYLEGWYVEPFKRRQGVGAALIAAAERWAAAHGCSEFGSDSPIDNHQSQLAHRALGFEETGRVVNFRKDLTR